MTIGPIVSRGVSLQIDRQTTADRQTQTDKLKFLEPFKRACEFQTSHLRYQNPTNAGFDKLSSAEVLTEDLGAEVENLTIKSRKTRGPAC